MNREQLQLFKEILKIIDDQWGRLDNLDWVNIYQKRRLTEITKLLKKILDYDEK